MRGPHHPNGFIDVQVQLYSDLEGDILLNAIDIELIPDLTWPDDTVDDWDGVIQKENVIDY